MITSGARSVPVQPEWKVPLSDVLVDEEILNAATDAVLSGWWSMGPRVDQFERAFAEYCGRRYAFAVSNGTAALHLALVATGCGPGDDVIVPSLNFVAAANVISHTGARPVFCDVVGPCDLNLDPADVEAAVGPATKAIMVLHYGGFPCDIGSVLEIAGRHGLVVIEDAAHAPGARWHGAMCGTFGIAGCFSFFANKNLAVGEGGMIVTDDEDVAAQIRLLRSHGMTTLTWARHQGHAHAYEVVARGFNYRADEVRAAIGLVQLRRLADANRARGRIVERYRSALDGVAGIRMPFAAGDGDLVSAHHLAVVVLPDDGLQSAVRASMNDGGVQTSIHYPPIHRFAAYADEPVRPLPETDRVSGRILTLPLYAHMSDSQVEHVVDRLIEAVAQASAAHSGSNPRR